MTARLRQFWAGRSLREQRMLLVMVALFAIVIVGFGIIRPLINARVAAAERLDAATVELGQVRGAADMLRRTPRTGPRKTVLNLSDTVAQSATAAGFTLANVGPQGDALRATIVSAKSPALFGWLRTLAQQGVLIDTLTIRTNTDSTLSMEATFRMQGQ